MCTAPYFLKIKLEEMKSILKCGKRKYGKEKCTHLKHSTSSVQYGGSMFIDRSRRMDSEVYKAIYSAEIKPNAKSLQILFIAEKWDIL